MMDRSVVLQVINGYLAVTGLAASLIFLRYIHHHLDRGYAELRAAIALFFLSFGEIILRTPQFIARTIANSGIAVAQPNLGLILGGIIVECAFLCVIRVFAPEKWGFWSWLATFIVATLVVGTSLLFVQWS